MRRMIPVRMPEELVARIDGKTENRSSFIVAAVEAYLGDGEGTKPKKMIIKKPKKWEESARDPEPETPKETEASAVSSGCGKHPGGSGFPKGGGWWCITCGRVVGGL